MLPSPNSSHPSPNSADREFLSLAQRIAGKYRRKQHSHHLDDEIESAAIFGLTKALKALSDNPDSHPGHETGFVAVCVRNAIVDALRLQANSSTLLAEAEIVDRTPANSWGEVEDADDLVGVKRESELLTELINRPGLLSDSQRRIMTLMRSGEGHTQKEIAAMLGLQKSAFSKQLAAAIEILRAAASELPLAA